MNHDAWLEALRNRVSREDCSRVHPVTGAVFVPIVAEARHIDDGKEFSAFYMSVHPVTNQEFQVFLEHSGYVPTDLDGFLKHWVADGVPGALTQHPVVFVNVFDALAYCAWARLFLPTESMWVRAAVGTDGRQYPWGNRRPSPALANLWGAGIKPVGSYPNTRTVHGCQDMIGNVSEWCNGISNPPEGRTPVRGSAWMRRTTAQGRMTGAHVRHLDAHRRNHWTGFRCAWKLERPSG